MRVIIVKLWLQWIIFFLFKKRITYLEMFILRKECAREHVCRHTAYESPERHKRHNMHELKQQNAFGWTDIMCTCIIYLFLLLFECHFTSFWLPWYINWNIVESGIKHHKPTNLFLNPKISTWPLLNLFSKNIFTGFLYTCINVLCIHNLPVNQFKKNALI